ncbi:Fur family transcriptional regulator [Actinosynnema mirum]|uniref:Ferric uptake regulator, Fur family n=1 Tax=Actinosynnema mirum (strain ATCC 29888 / DSM 43827 / JCM 3225 / NBRC 14064 / NCIMB 13271 / NRRL B-12336 / IMRU 3971 / 101) TaxID=446462 RepID=C6WK47_ACTMD|nr:Fur family transcriptional regulator [Actinosynnema mirum]ACU38260.1 ferric uptake regulator, Fur family [Actinosynnema mirum DSM 43827]
MRFGRDGSGSGGGVRLTARRRAVLVALSGLPGPAGASVVHRRVRADGERIGLTGVYRLLAILVDAGLVGVTKDGGGRHLFHLRVDSSHDHHLLCGGCGRAERVDAGCVLGWAETAAAAHGFRDVSVSIVLSGVCPECGRAAEPGVDR